ncbi:MAG TPA: alpha/beta fold hydrolase [Stellaceae bacterium]|nr:alpha/beta fold hydrolase [Stellaceae bacterium]
MDETPRLTLPALPDFLPRAPWWGGDLQTISNYLRPRPRLSAAPERLILPLSDGTGDRLAAALDRPAEPRAELPLMVMLHGLSGDELSANVMRSTKSLLAQGYTVLRLNLRGAGPSRPLSRLQYHAGRSEDLAMALDALPPALTANGIAAVGYSLGGNMLLKFLGERGTASPVRAAVSVSAPIDLAATSIRMLKWRNSPYQAYLMREIRTEALMAISEITATERERVRAARTIRDFDNGFTAPRNGFADADDYYAKTSAKRFLDGIRVPTLVIHAKNDPWVPVEPYLAHDWRANSHLFPVIAPSGGHVGFLGRDRTANWHDLAIGTFLEQAFSRP